MKRIFFNCLSVFWFCLLSGNALAVEPAIRIVPKEGEVYIYHTHRLPPGHGFNVYRQDRPGGDFDRINEKVIRGAARSDDLRPMLGDRYQDVLQIFEAESPAGIWLGMRTRRFEAGLASFLFPKAAFAMGRLFVDESPPVNREATYRIEFVNNMDRPTGKELQKTILLEPQQPDPPLLSSAENTGRRVTLKWEYPRVGPDEDDFVIQFYVYRLDHKTGEPELLNHRVVIRNNAVDVHQYTFESPVINTVERYVVTAVDITGQQSDYSNIYEYELIYNIPPKPIYEVSASVTRDPWVELEWEPAGEPGIAGYHIYRSSDMSKPFERFTETPTGPSELFFLDSTVVGGTSYFYFVTAVDNQGNESEKGSVAMARVPDLFPPPRPGNFKAEYDPDTREVKLSWEMEEFTRNFETFIIMRRREDVLRPGALSRVNPEMLTNTTFRDKGDAGAGFLEGGSYRYVLFSSSTSKRYSDTVSVVLDIPVVTAPEAPKGLVANNDNGFRVNLNWGAVSSLNLEKYAVYRKESGEEDFLKIKEVPMTTRFFRDEGTTVGNNYVYSVTAIDVAGNESEFSTPDTIFFRDNTPPRSVRNIQALAHEDGVELRWERVVATDLAGYKVYRADIPTGRYEPLHEGLLNETGFFDQDGDIQSWYRVRAVDTSGNQSRPGSPVRPVETNN